MSYQEMRKTSYTHSAVRHRMSKLGLRVKVVEFSEAIEARLMKGSRQVGEVSLHLCLDGKWMTYSYKGIEERYRGKGIGLYLYDKLLRYGLGRGFKIKSDTCRSYDADQVWEKLRGRFRIRRVMGSYRVYGKKNDKLL